MGSLSLLVLKPLGKLSAGQSLLYSDGVFEISPLSSVTHHQLQVCRLTCLLCPFPHCLHLWSPLRRGLQKLPDCVAPAARGAGFALSFCATEFSHHSRSVCLLVLGSSELLLSFSCLPSWAMFAVPADSSCQPCGHGWTMRSTGFLVSLCAAPPVASLHSACVLPSLCLKTNKLPMLWE